MRRPMKRLIEKIVFWGLVTACRFATWPTSRSPSFVNATTDGVTRPPSALGMTTGSPPSITANHEVVGARFVPVVFPGLARAPHPKVDGQTESGRGRGRPGAEKNAKKA